MNVRKALLSAMIGLAMVGALAACGGTNHDAPNPQQDIQLQWHRIETPPSVVTEFFACFGTDGLLLDQADGNVSVTPDDPMCPKDGTPYRWVTRQGSQPAVVIQTTSGPVTANHP